MAGQREGRRFFLIGLGVIVLFYILYYVVFVYHVFLVVPMRLRQLIKLGFILLTYGTGVWALRKDTARWIMKIWHLLYGCTFLFLILLGVLDGWLGRMSPAVREVAGNLHEFLISPVLYIVIGLLRRRMPQ
ncbi:hypothetical protein Q4E93_30930 [Flavitalea sp. BT771]|uniref:hypothetical protein n=1 Tax=Flavitalea sp. BT771 TaxID=3063329 RepID=UPI0026E1B79D|nr:hypothetical protein [Flavitalea sp. BT771]MDO6435070.1 hypothetical protein [Flavitalea sp. BT771]MDV6223970.1 hypothetical protein [Flavitalea sp. BT771]